MRNEKDLSVRHAPIEGYEGLYEITEDGRVWSIRRNQYLLFSHKKDGYKRVGLSNKGKTKTIAVHRLVAKAFVENPNPEKFDCVNHKDQNPAHNHYSNLEWCDKEYNTNYADRAERYAKSRGHITQQYDLEGNLLNEFESISEASRITGVSIASIYNNVSGKCEKTCGYIFKYKGE